MHQMLEYLKETRRKRKRTKVVGKRVSSLEDRDNDAPFPQWEQHSIENEVEESEESVLPPWKVELEQGERESIEPHSRVTAERQRMTHLGNREKCIKEP